MISDPPEDLGHGLGLTLRQGTPIILGQRGRLGVDQRGEHVEHGGIVEPGLQKPAAPVAVRGQGQLVGLDRFPIVRLDPVLIQQLQQLGPPLRNCTGV